MILIPERAASLKRKPDPISILNGLLHICYHKACIDSIVNALAKEGYYNGDLNLTNANSTYPVNVTYIYA